MNDARAAANGEATPPGATDRETDRDGYQLRHYVSVLRRRKLAILIPTLLGIALGLFLGTVQPRSWTSTAEVIAQPTSPESALAGTGGTPAGSDASQTATEVAVMGSQAVKNEAKARVGHDVEVTVATDPDSAVSRLTGEGEDKAQVQKDVQAYAESYVQLRQGQLAATMAAGIAQVETNIADVNNQINGLAEPIAALDQEIGVTYDSVIRNGLENQRGELTAQRDGLSSRRDALLDRLDALRLAQTVNPTYGVQVLAPASDPEEAGGPGRLSLAIAGGGIGFLLGLVLAFVREHFDERVFGKPSLEAVSGLPVVGMLPRVRGLDRGAAVVAELPSSPAAVEAFRSLRTTVQLALASGGAARC